MVQNRISKILNSNRLQYGFVPNRGTIEAITALKLILTHRLNQNEDTYLCFVDFEKAFDDVNYQKLLDVIRKRDVPEKCLRLISQLYQEQKGYLRGYENLPINIRRGVRQGRILSPVLYNTYMTMKEGVTIGEQRINRIMYADDTVLLADSENGINKLLQQLHELGREYDININIKKTKCMKVSKSGMTGTKVKLVNNKIECTQNFKYLGINVTCDGRDDTEIATRIAMARQVFLKHEELLRNGLSLKLKKLILKTYVWSVLRYGSEVWVMKKTTVKKIDAFEMWCYRRILKMDRPHH